MKKYDIFLDGKQHVIAIVGAGGKTTVMYEMAAYFADCGKKVVVSTTTHIFRPTENYAADEQEVSVLWKQNRYAVIGAYAENNKLTMSDAELLNKMLLKADIVLLEADGAKGLPCKVPAVHEPVILSACDIVIAVMGMDALKRPVPKVCFRLNETLELLQCSKEHLLTEADMAAILVSDRGSRKGVADRKFFVVLNKCDSKAAVKSALQIAAALQHNNIPSDNILLRGEAVHE